MIATPSIASLSRPTYSVPDVNRLRRSFPGRPWQNYEAGHYEDALRFAIKVRPKDAPSFANFMGVERDKCGLYQEALSFFNKALGLDPKYANAWSNKGAALGNLGRNEEAITCYDKALEIDPKDAYALNNKGGALYNLGRYEEAITCFEKALEIDPKLALAWNNKGAALDNLGRHEEALSCCEKALEIDPKYAKAWNNKGVALGNLGRNEEAITCYEKALEIDPKDAYALNNKGLALYNLGRYKEAIEEYYKALELNRDYVSPHINLAVLLSVTNNHEEAAREFREALRLFKEKEPKRLEEALRYLEKELDAHHDSHSLWRAKAEFLKALGREAEAQKSLQTAEELESLEIPDIEHDIVVKMLPPIETWRVIKAKVKHHGRATPRVVIDLVED